MDASKAIAITDDAEQPICKMCRGLGTILVLQLNNLVVASRDEIIDGKPIIRVDADSVGESNLRPCFKCGGTGLSKEKHNA